MGRQQGRCTARAQPQVKSRTGSGCDGRDGAFARWLAHVLGAVVDADAAGA